MWTALSGVVIVIVILGLIVRAVRLTWRKRKDDSRASVIYKAALISSMAWLLGLGIASGIQHGTLTRPWAIVVLAGLAGVALLWLAGLVTALVEGRAAVHRNRELEPGQLQPRYRLPTPLYASAWIVSALIGLALAIWVTGTALDSMFPDHNAPDIFVDAAVPVIVITLGAVIAVAISDVTRWRPRRIDRDIKRTQQRRREQIKK